VGPNSVERKSDQTRDLGWGELVGIGVDPYRPTAPERVAAVTADPGELTDVVRVDSDETDQALGHEGH
jgi:hypothetical protein